MVTALVVGGLIGLVVGVSLGFARGGRRFGVAYGLLAAGIVWSASAILAGSRADGMAGIGRPGAGWRPALVPGGARRDRLSSDGVSQAVRRAPIDRAVSFDSVGSDLEGHAAHRSAEPARSCRAHIHRFISPVGGTRR